MKATPFLILLSVHSSLCFGDTIADSQKELNLVRAERAKILQTIVAQVEQGLRDGTSGMREFIEAKIDLLEHERAGELSARGKIIPQQGILDLEEKRHSIVKQLMRSGGISNLEILKSRERLLATKQLLLEYKVEARSKIAVGARKEKE